MTETDAAALGRGTTTADALRVYDDLPAVALDELLGSWRGSGVPTGHPMDGLLEAYGWHGKRFEGAEDGHPLVFRGPRGLFSANPALVPMGLVLRLGPRLRPAPVAAVGRRAVALARTRAPHSRLRAVEHRGVVTATMVYDDLPIADHFRRLDEATLLGVMDLRGMTQPFVFLLHRET
ncbi:DUF4334 domain-containing protein [Nocardioides lentus]|uniref:DUF4334 domain-containing protein n=1 Tax=Nocardioides lentus TaxID=338077 RepID=A0ABN2PSS9_9ACTN